MASLPTLILTALIWCVTAQKIIYNINTQGVCTEKLRGPTRDCRWVAGLDMVDQTIEKGRIIAYKIRWFNGNWSGWYVPGINDLSEKYNNKNVACSVPYRRYTMRRRWAVFYDHVHRFIICKPRY